MTWPTLSHDLLEGRGARTSRRVQAVHLLSRAVTALLLGVAAVAVLIAVRAPDARPATPFGSLNASSVASGHAPGGHDQRAGDTPQAVATGQEVSRVVGGIDRSVAAVRGDIIELRIDNPRGVRADLALRADLPDPGASAIAVLLERLEQSGLDGPRIASVVAVPGGGRLDVVGSFTPSTVPRPRVSVQQHHADVSVRLADLAASADIELRRLDTGDAERDGSIRLHGAGDLEAIVRLLTELEDDLRAPSRIRTLRLDRASEQGDRQLDVTFLLRAPAPRASSAGEAP